LQRFEGQGRVVFVQLQKLVEEIELPGVDVVKREHILLVVLHHGAEEAGVALEEIPFDFVVFAVLGGDGGDDCLCRFGLHRILLWLTGKIRLKTALLIISYEGNQKEDSQTSSSI
jgi:hypothetical protein